MPHKNSRLVFLFIIFILVSVVFTQTVSASIFTQLRSTFLASFYQVITSFTKQSNNPPVQPLGGNKSVGSWAPPIGIPHPGDWFLASSSTNVILVTSGQSSRTFSGTGTAANPVIYRGVGDPQFSEITISGSYVIVENVKVVLPRSDNGVDFSGDHLALKNSEVANGPDKTTSAVVLADDNNIVLYNNSIHDNGDWQATYDQDHHGIGFGANVNNVWILNNQFYHNSGDGVQITNGNDPCPLRETVHDIFIGNNTAWENKQTGFWVKCAVDVVFSQNTSYAHLGGINGDGTGMGGQYQADRIWFLFNKVYGNARGLGTGDIEGTMYFIGNLSYGNIDQGFNSWGPGTRYLINNTIADNPRGLDLVNGNNNFINNIFTGVIDGEQYLQEDQTNLFGSVSNMQFVNAGQHDYHLQSISPARNTGTGSGTLQTVFNAFQSRFGIDIKKDYDALARPQEGTWDIGAFEYSDAGTVPDTTPPVISNVQSNPGSTTATITWATDEPATSQVEYGLTTGYGQSTTLDSTLVTNHSVSLSGLTPSAAYHFRVRSKDASQNERVSEDSTLATMVHDSFLDHYQDVGLVQSLVNVERVTSGTEHYMEPIASGSGGEINPTGSLGAGLVGLWHLNGNASDSSSGGNSGSVRGNPTWVAAKYGSGLSFDGSGDGLHIPNSASLNTAAGPGQARTWAYWFKDQGSADNKLMSDKGGGSFPGNHFWSEWHTDPARIFGGVNTSEDHQLISSTISTNAWHHVAFTYDGANARLYIDGLLNAGPNPQTAPIDDTQSLEFMSTSAGGSAAKGVLDEIAIWNRALSPSDIQALASGQTASGSFESKPGVILQNTTISNLKTQWSEAVGTAASVQVSTNAGATWTTVSNGQVLAGPLVVTDLRYRVNFSGMSHLESLQMDWDQVGAPPACLKGDVSGDGLVNFADINSFVWVLTHLSQATPAQLCAADLNNDGVVNFDDISPFDVLLSRSGVPNNRLQSLRQLQKTTSTKR